MSKLLDFNFGDLDDQTKLLVAQELSNLLRQEALQEEIEQLEVAQAHLNSAPRAVDGIGEQKLAISPTLFIHYKTVEQLDFSNPRDIRWFGNRFPEARVTSTGTRLQVGHKAPVHTNFFNDRERAERSVRWTKTYSASDSITAINPCNS